MRTLLCLFSLLACLACSTVNAQWVLKPSDSTKWVPGPLANPKGVEVTGSRFFVVDATDATKILKFDASGISTGTTRTFGVPNASGTLAIVSGDLGTPSAVVLTNATGLPLATGITGTLPIANGGTGATTAAAARTNLGATTLGVNLFTITNPSAITFPRYNADNTATALSASAFRTAIGAGDALVANPLSQFAATTSAQLSGVLSDEIAGTGGKALFGNQAVSTDSSPGFLLVTVEGVRSPTFLPLGLADTTIVSGGWLTSGGLMRVGGTLVTDTSSSGTVAAANDIKFNTNTVAASSVTTFTHYSTAYFAEPAAGTNVTLTNKWGLSADSMRIGTSNPLTISSLGVLTANSAQITNLGVGTAPIAQQLIRAIGTTSGGISHAAVVVVVTGDSSATTAIDGISAQVSTSAAAYTVADVSAVRINPGTPGAGSTMTREHGINIFNLVNGTTVYGIRSRVSSGTNKWGNYFEGTANNAYAGASRFGGVTVPVATVDVTGSIAATTTILSSGATSGIGYSAGAGGSVVQVTSRITGCTLNRVCGTIQTDTTALLAGANATFTVTNSAVAIGDVIDISVRSGATNVDTIVRVTAVAAGSFNVSVLNKNVAVSEVGAIIINFVVVKGVSS